MKREIYLQKIHNAFDSNQACAIIGPRQCGKSTLSREYATTQSRVHFFDLENPIDLARLTNPMLSLQSLQGLVIIDEIQRHPELFSVLRVLIDKGSTKYLILGSASRDLLQQSSETLAGRISYIELTPFSYYETKESTQLWSRGGYPKSYLATSDIVSYTWRNSYITTFLEQDIPNLGINIPAQTLRRFWMMIAHCHGNIFNASELGRSLGYSNTTIMRYLDILVGTFMVRKLNPWFENIHKRQVKSPKIYIRDSGILHALLGVNNQEQLFSHPKLGASWEGFALEEVIRQNNIYEHDCYFWATHNNAELDLMVFKNGKRYGFEIKYTDFPKVTPSMRIALENLQLEFLVIIIPGNQCFMLDKKIVVCGLNSTVQIDKLIIDNFN